VRIIDNHPVAAIHIHSSTADSNIYPVKQAFYQPHLIPGSDHFMGKNSQNPLKERKICTSQTFLILPIIHLILTSYSNVNC
jgi:hypothetical protein